MGAAHFHRRWELGDTLQVGIGQSALEITPLQSARVIAAIANGGKLVTPRLVARIGEETQPGREPVPPSAYPRRRCSASPPGCKRW